MLVCSTILALSKGPAGRRVRTLAGADRQPTENSVALVCRNRGPAGRAGISVHC
jgi:hypothetical protein